MSPQAPSLVCVCLDLERGRQDQMDARILQAPKSVASSVVGALLRDVDALEWPGKSVGGDSSQAFRWSFFRVIYLGASLPQPDQNWR